jgi:hypothetical protein
MGRCEYLIWNEVAQGTVLELCTVIRAMNFAAHKRRRIAGQSASKKSSAL